MKDLIRGVGVIVVFSLLISGAVILANKLEAEGIRHRELRVFEKEHDGHLYKFFKVDGQESGVVHSPDCPCQ